MNTGEPGGLRRMVTIELFAEAILHRLKKKERWKGAKERWKGREREIKR